MIEKKKIELKKGVACLLAALQIGVVAGCNQKDISEHEYSDIEMSVFALEQGSKNLNNKTKIDLTNGVNPINANLINELGLTSKILELPLIKNNIAKLNEYLKSYIESFSTHRDLYYVIYDINDGEKMISILNSKNVVICSITKTNNYIYFNYENPGKVYVDELDNQEFNYSLCLSSDSTVYEKSWKYNEDYYAIHSHKILVNNNLMEEAKISHYVDDPVDNHGIFSFEVTFNNDGQSSYTLTFNRFDKKVNFQITETDYLILTDLLESYKENESEDILAYFRETLTFMIQKYDKNNECDEFIDVLNEHRARALK